LDEGELLNITAGPHSASAPARIDKEMPHGMIGLFVPQSTGGLAGRKALEPLYQLETNPTPVEVKKNAV